MNTINVHPSTQNSVKGHRVNHCCHPTLLSATTGRHVFNPKILFSKALGPLTLKTTFIFLETPFKIADPKPKPVTNNPTITFFHLSPVFHLLICYSPSPRLILSLKSYSKISSLNTSLLFLHIWSAADFLSREECFVFLFFYFLQVLGVIRLQI